MSSIPSVLRDLLKGARVKHFPRGQIMLYEGDTPSEVLVLKSGAVKLFDIDSQGNEKILHIVKAPAMIPFVPSKDGQPISWFYASLSDCDVYVLSISELLQQLKEKPELYAPITEGLSLDMHEVLVRLSSLGKTNVQEKLTAVLKFLQVHHTTASRTGWYRVNFLVSHQLLADLSGVTRESVAMAMRDFQKRKAVRYPRMNVLEIHQARLLDM